MPRTPKCKAHPKQSLYNCVLCDQAVKSMVEKLLRRFP